MSRYAAYECACALLSGGWTSEDYEEFEVEYDFSSFDLFLVVDAMQRIENGLEPLL